MSNGTTKLPPVTDSRAYHMSHDRLTVTVIS